MGARRTAKRAGKWPAEQVGEFLAEAILNVVACVLLGSLILITYLSWTWSPRLTVAGFGLFGLLLAHGAWRTFRAPAKSLGCRRTAAVTTAIFTAVAATAFFLLAFAADCGCL
ncbi:lysine transporter LysE [Streptomyces solicathayae]|uniref:Lysine transporter LysE n=1 Tax=Streptomyces solicathayae TaxID=3081768 RepID=A0ABZ0M3Q3_9ACTN|nr:lysine transporter LysE [Streptomyces sp. HUAS YS2]WOX26408.1 lysine transporter LysE [Streptomyces sp. HUAS YS2]